MKRAVAWVKRIVRIVATLWFKVYFTYYVWKTELTEVWKALRHVTVQDITHAALMSVLVAMVIYALSRLRGWPHYTVYHWLAPLVKRRMKPMHRENLEIFQAALKDPVEDDDSNDDEEDDADEDDAYADDAALARLWLWRLEYWSERATNFGFMLLTCIGINGLLHGAHTPAIWLAVRLLGVLVCVSLLAVPLRYVVGAALLAIWLDYVAITAGEEQSGVYAALTGVVLLLWSFWERWQEKTRMASEPPVQE